MVKLQSTIVLLIYTVSHILCFNEDDGVVKLKEGNFYDVVGSTNKLWIIKFYVHYCGACIRFQPTFSAFSKSIRGWNSIIGVGEVSCGEDASLCLALSEKNVPTVKLYVPHSSKGSPKVITLTVGVVSLEDLIKSCLDELNKLSPSKQGYLLPVLKPISNLEDVIGHKTKSMFLIVEDENARKDRIGELVILDNAKYLSAIMVYRTTLEDASKNMDVFETGLFELTPDRKRLSNTHTELQRVSINKKLASYTGRPSISGSFDDNYVVSHLPPVVPMVTDDTYVYRKAHGLYMADLITNLRYSLMTEVPSVSRIDKDAHEALKNYIHILILYHPADAHVMAYLKLLHNWLLEHPAPITSDQWKRALSSIKSPEAYIPMKSLYSGCQSSRKYLRGYPCSLWMTFHALTVRAHLIGETNEARKEKVGLDILLAIRGYIKHFFMCSECSNNFVHYSQDLLNQNEGEKWPAKRAVLDLWRRHNRVNEKLHLQPQTEDPDHPKIQFPALQDCPTCRNFDPRSVFESNSTHWNEENVFNFLVDYYKVAASSCADIGVYPFTGKWSSCSRSCDTGVSLRLSNKNSDCTYRYETRLCMERPCSLKFPDWNRSPWHMMNCPKRGHTYQLSTPMKLQLAGCTTKKSEKLKVCGVCPPRALRRQPVCCKPVVSETRLVDVSCKQFDENDGDHREGEEEFVWLNNRNRTNSVYLKDTKMPMEFVDLCSCSESLCN